jgi:hypothetical protein
MPRGEPNLFSSIPGLDVRHRAVLRRLGMTNAEALAAADAKQILAELRKAKVVGARIADVERWQREARELLARESPDEAHQRTSFAVVFELRREGDGWVRELQVEQTEIEPPPSEKRWKSWDCAEICAWMIEKLPVLPKGAHEPSAGGDVAPVAEDLSLTVPDDDDVPTGRGGPTALRFDEVTLTDASGEMRTVTADVAKETTEVAFSGRARMSVVISGAPPTTEVLVGLVRRRPSSTEATLPEPAATQDGRAELDLGVLELGTSELRLQAFTPDGSAVPAAFRLPILHRQT